VKPLPDSLPELSSEETRRYGRQLILPELGVEGQKRLKAGRVLLIGAGGLGSPLAMYLGAAGVGTLGLADFDLVDESNLHRQLLHGTEDVGRPKVDSAEERLRAVNPHVKIVKHSVQVRAADIRELVSQYDLVADGSDNFATRYVVNDACVLEGKPNVWGAVFQFEGQASVFGLEGGPCYRCLYPDPPPPGSVPNCAEGGVLGVLPGIIGLLQANEVIKLISGVGQPLSGRMLLFDALGSTFREVRLARDENCPVCGENPTITEPVDYEGYCTFIEDREEAPVAEETTHPLLIGVHELQRRRAASDGLLLLDVRMPQELAIVALDDSINIPLQELGHRFGELDPDEEIAVLCHTGVRSMQATQFLKSQGFRQPRSVDGGIERYAVEVDTSLSRY